MKCICHLKNRQKHITSNTCLQQSCESAFCWFDSVQLRKVFSNLISNALKFTNDNGSVELSLIKNNEMFIIRLIDNGIGIEARRD